MKYYNNLQLAFGGTIMIIVIDAYNLLKQILKSNFVTPKEKDLFIDEVRRYASYKNHDIVIVFDGGSNKYPVYQNIGRVNIIHSGFIKSADEVIKDYVSKNKANNILLVSSDAELCLFVSKLKKPTIDSDLFYKLITEHLEKPEIRVEKSAGKAVKLIKIEENSELDAFMQEASNILMYKEEIDDANNIKQKKKNILSKNEKKLLKITKKL